MDKAKQEAKFKAIADYIAKIPTRKSYKTVKPNENKKEEAKADMCMMGVDVCDVPSPTYSDIQWLSSQIDTIRQDYWDLWNQLYDHMNNGHIPQIVGAEAMQKALKVLGLDGDYQVQPKVIYASNGKPEAVQLTISK